jgi:hypothetical protein
MPMVKPWIHYTIPVCQRSQSRSPPLNVSLNLVAVVVVVGGGLSAYITCLRLAGLACLACVAPSHECMNDNDNVGLLKGGSVG